MSTTKLKSCCIVGCKNQNIGADSGVIFYKFPEERKLKAKWIEACKKNDALKDKKWEPPAGAVICNVHFVSGQKSLHDWHPDYVPSVFRSLRRNIVKKKGFFDDSDDESSSRPRLKTPTVKRLQQAASAKRASLSTPSTSSKGKGVMPASLKKGRPPNTGGLRKPLRLTKKAKAGPKSKVLKTDEIIDLMDSPLKSSQSSDAFVDEEPDDKSNLSVFVLPENKRKHAEKDLKEDDPATPLKTLSVVLERTSEKKIKLTTGEITIKEEPLGDVDYILPQKIAPITKKVISSSPKIVPSKISKPVKLPAKPVAKFRKSPLKDQCKNCANLKQKVLDLETNAVSNKVNEKCQRCPVIEHELKKVEEELEDIIESKLSKCQRCSLVEQKCKRVENNLRKAQTELSKVQNKLANIEICEESFKKYKSKVKLYTGFPNFDSLMLVFDHVKTRLPPEPAKGMSQFQMFILVMMRLKLNLPFWDLTYRFGASPNNIQSFYPLYINVLESTLSHVVLWPKANMQFRLQVLGSNLRQSFLVIQTPVKEETLMMPSSNKMPEGDKVTRVCAALYHIAQLVSSNHSQQLVRILKSKDDLEKKPTEPGKNLDKISRSDETPSAGDTVTTPDTDKKANGNGVLEMDASPVMNGEEDVDDSDIFFEDFTKDISEGANSNDSLELECKHLRKELNNLTQKLSCQFKFYTGLRNFEVFNNLLGFLEPYVSHIKTERLSHFQQLHLVLIRYKLSLDVQDLAYVFNVDTDHVVYLTRVWTDVMSQQLKQYIEWSTGVEDAEGEKRLLGTVKLKYHMLWKPQLAPRNRDTNSDKEKLDMRKLLRACGSIYYIDDIELIRDGVKENKIFSLLDSAEKNSNEELEKECLTLRTEIYDLRKHIMSCISSCLNEESLQNNDQMVRYYTGFPSFEVLKNIFNLIFPTTKPENRKTISPFQQFLALLVRLKLNISTNDIAYRFGMGQSNTHKLIQDWMVWLHTQLAPHITWPDDDEDVEVFTEMLRKTYAYLKNSISPRKNERKSETGFFDIATLVCAGLYNVGEVSFNKQSDSEFESFDEDW